MKRMLILVALFAASMAQAQDIAGDWQGTLNTGMGELRLVLHITKTADGSLKATLDSVDLALLPTLDSVLAESSGTEVAPSLQDVAS